MLILGSRPAVYRMAVAKPRTVSAMDSILPPPSDRKYAWWICSDGPKEQQGVVKCRFLGVCPGRFFKLLLFIACGRTLASYQTATTHAAGMNTLLYQCSLPHTHSVHSVGGREARREGAREGSRGGREQREGGRVGANDDVREEGRVEGGSERGSDGASGREDAREQGRKGPGHLTRTVYSIHSHKPAVAGEPLEVQILWQLWTGCIWLWHGVGA